MRSLHRPTFLGISALIAVVSVQFFLSACLRSPEPEPRPQAGSAWTPGHLSEERGQRDLSFKNGTDSPIPERDKARFTGLAYFPPDANLRFRVKLNRYPRPEMLRIGTNTGEIRTGLRYGYFDFEIEGRQCRLQVYRMDDSLETGAPNLFVPFRDATSGKDTYGAGRYIDLRENTSGIYDLDFNRAYNPSCAYGREGFSCPVPPPENTLPVPVRAGEKMYPLGEEH